jgi:hypothetical protein
MIAVLAASRAWRSIYLGPELPAEEGRMVVHLGWCRPALHRLAHRLVAVPI